MLFVYLLVCRNSKILAHVYLRFIKVNFPFTKRGGGVSGENCHFRLRSTTSGPHFDPHDTHSLRYMTQMNELKNEEIKREKPTCAIFKETSAKNHFSKH